MGTVSLHTADERDGRVLMKPRVMVDRTTEAQGKESLLEVLRALSLMICGGLVKCWQEPVPGNGRSLYLFRDFAVY